jgi:putative chitinase
MGTPFEDLALSVLMQRQDEISKFNPYSGLQGVADVVGQSATKLGATGNYGLGETALATGLAGLASGILGNYAGDYQKTLTDRYAQSALTGDQGELPSGLFASAQNDSSLFKLREAARQADIFQQAALDNARLEKQNALEIRKMLIQNPRLAKSLGATNLSVGLAGAVPSEAASTDVIAKPVIPTEKIEEAKVEKPSYLDSLGLKSLAERYDEIKNKALDENPMMTPNAASEEANIKLKSEMAANTKDLAELDVLSKKQSEVDDLITRTTQNLKDVGSTGGIPGVPFSDTAQGLKKWATDDTAYAAWKDLDTTQILTALRSRIAGTGAMSDTEFDKYLSTAPGTDKTPEANQRILENMVKANGILRNYLDFKEQFASKYGTTRKADLYWRRDVKPKVLANPELNWEDAMSMDLESTDSQEMAVEKDTPFADQNLFSLEKKNLNNTSFSPPPSSSKVKAYARGGINLIANAPKAIEAVGDLGDLFGKAVRGDVQGLSEYMPQTREELGQTLDTIGRGAANVVGAGIGGTVGSVVPVAGTVAGISAGAGLGDATYSAFKNYLTSENPELSEEQVLQAYESAGGAGVLQALSSVAKGTKGISEAVKRRSNQGIPKQEEALLGVKAGDIKKSAVNKSYGYLEDVTTGKLVDTAEDAVGIQSQLSKSVQIVKEDGLLKSLTNDVSKNKATFDIKKKAANEAVSNVHKATEDAISSYQKANGVTIRLKPSFSEVDDYLNSLKNTSKTNYQFVKREVDAIKKAYEGSDKSYSSIRKLEQDIGKNTNWNASEDAIQNLNKAKKMIYGSYRDTLLKANQEASKISSSVPNLAEANKVSSAYANLDKLVTSKAIEGQGGLSNVFSGNGFLQSVLQAPEKFIGQFPKSALGFKEGVNKYVTKPATNVVSGVSTPFTWADELPGAGSLFSIDESKKKVLNEDKVKPEDISLKIEEAGITDPIEKAQFLGQLDHESMGFRKLVEIGGGKKYEGRKDLGNTEKGDGERFKGRGYIQLTGRANYKKYGDMIGVDLIANPDLASEPETAIKLAVAYWKDRVAPKVSDFSDTRTVTKLINGGYNGLEDRIRRVKKYQQTIA